MYDIMIQQMKTEVTRHGVRELQTPREVQDVIPTVFATTDREATAAAREYFTGQPPSSPSFALLRDHKLVAMVHRSDIERSSPEQTAALLTSMFDRHCSTAVTH